MTLILVRASLAAQPVAVGALTPLVYYGNTLPAKVETAHLPCRLLFAGDMSGRNNSGSFVALGKMAQTTRQISDVLLWQTTAGGIGRSGVEQDLSTYCDNYETMLRNWRNAGQSAAHVLDWNIDIVEFEYPKLSSFWCWAVLVVNKIQEYATG